MVHFEVVSRHIIDFDGDADNLCTGASPTNGICLEPQKVVQHNGALGDGFRIVYPDPADRASNYGPAVDPNASDPDDPVYIEDGRKDMVTALPGQVTKIRAKFDKPGRYVWYVRETLFHSCRFVL